MKHFACLLLIFSLSISSFARASDIRTVALTGQQAPGTPDGTIFTSSGASVFVVLNDAGQTAFWARVAGNGVNSTNQFGIWSEGSGSLALVARTGSQAPGTPPA